MQTAVAAVADASVQAEDAGLDTGSGAWLQALALEEAWQHSAQQRQHESVVVQQRRELRDVTALLEEVRVQAAAQKEELQRQLVGRLTEAQLELQVSQGIHQGPAAVMSIATPAWPRRPITALLPGLGDP